MLACLVAPLVVSESEPAFAANGQEDPVTEFYLGELWRLSFRCIQPSGTEESPNEKAAVSLSQLLCMYQFVAGETSSRKRRPEDGR